VMMMGHRLARRLARLPATSNELEGEKTAGHQLGLF
jgi:hypothetical protein